MENFAQYILEEKELIAKMEIEYYLSKKEKVFFDKSVVVKTELARNFINYMDIKVDLNTVLTASLLCNCKKIDNPQTKGKLRTYAKEGADYLRSLGFDKRICKMCEEVNRYSNSNPREKESDILELVDQYGGMLLDRDDRNGFKIDEALVILEYRNLKGLYNRYLEAFKMYINEMEKFEIALPLKIGSISYLASIANEPISTKELIKRIAMDYQSQIDKKIQENREQIKEKIYNLSENSSRPLFSAETTRKIMEKVEKENADLA